MTTSSSRSATLRRTLIAAGFLAASIISCERTPTGLATDGAPRFARAFSVAPTFPPAFQTAGAGDVVSFTHVRIVLRHPDGSIALDTVIVFPPDVDEVPLELRVPILATAPPSGESMALTMKYVNAAGDTVFSGGPVTLTVAPSVAGAPPPPPVNVPVSYTGVGATAAKVVISPKTLTVFGGDPVGFTAQAFDAGGTLIPGTPVIFSTSDATVVNVAPGGSGSALSKRGTATITAQLLTGQTDAATVNVLLHASAIGLVSGNGQTSPFGSLLAQPVVVRATAPDGVGVAGVTVTFAAGSGGAAGDATVVTDASGLALTTWRLGNSLGVQTLTASAAGLSGSPVTFSATSQAGPAAQLVFTGQPANSVAGSAIGGPITVAVQDAAGNVNTTFTGAVSIALAANANGAGLSGATSVNAVNGIAVFSGAIVNRAGSGYTIVAGASGLTGATSSPFSVAAGPAALLALVSGGGQTAPAGSVLAPVTVAVTDIAGNGISGFAVTFVSVTGGGTVAPAVATTGTNGQATTTWTLGATVGLQSIAAAGTGLASLAITATATAAGPVATQLSITTQPTNTTAGAAINPAVVITARDATGAPATTFTGNVTLSIGTNPGAGTLGGTATVAAVAGVATFTTLNINKSGVGYTLVASSGALTPATTAAFNITAGAAAQLAFTVQPSATSAGVPIAPVVQVAAQDVFGNIATAFTGVITLAIGTNPGGATLTGTAAVAAVAGVASFPTIGLTALGVGYTLSATAPALTATVSTPFTIAAGILTWTNPAGGNWSTPSNWSLGRVPLPTDSVVIALAGTYGVSLDTTFTGAYIAVGGASGTQTLSLNSRTLTISGAVTVGPNAVFSLTIATVAGAGALTNQGLIFVHGASAINVPYTSAAGSTIRAEGSAFGTGQITMASGFTNNGLLELTSAGSGFPANVVAPSLTNAAGGTISVLPGVGGTRTLTTALTNAGTMTLAAPLLMDAVNAAHANSGTITITGGTLTLNQTGGAPNFTNTGAITIGAGQTWAVSGGTLNQNAGTIGGTGLLTLSSVTANFATNFTNTSTGVSLTNTTWNGAGTLTNATGQTLIMVASTIGATGGLVNQGVLDVRGNSAITGPLTTVAGSTLRVNGSSNGSGILTVAGGFTNNAAIELTSAGSGFPSQIVTPALTNAAGATISALPGVGGARTLSTVLTNLGTVTISAATVMDAASAAHTNSGTLDISGASLTLSQTGTTPSFTNTGAVTIGAGLTWAVNGGTLNLNGGSVGGTGTLALSTVTMNLATGITNAVTALTLTSTTVNGPGTITNAVGQSLSLLTSTIGATSGIVNQGLLIVRGSSVVNGSLTTVAGSTLRVDGSALGSGILTVAGGFTNNADIELTSTGSGFPAQIVTPALTNAAGANITALPGVGGTRTLTTAFTNLGTITLNTALTISAASAAHTNGGTINMTGGTLTLTQTGTTPSFTNTGTITIGAGQSWSISGGTINFSAGSVAGTGTLALASLTLNLAAGFSNATTGLSLVSTTVNGPGTITNAVGQTLTLATSTISATSGLVNQGLLIITGSSVINGPLTTVAGSTLRADGSAAGTGILTVAGGFTNNAAIELSSSGSGFPSQIITPALTNAAGATISALPGVGGSRSLTTALTNLGTITIGTPTVLDAVGAAHASSGTINVSGGTLTLTQTGTTPSFTNTGTITIGGGFSFAISGGTLNLNAGSVGGTGTLALNTMTVNLAAGFTNATTGLTVVGTNVNGPGALTNATGQTLTLATSTIGATSALINQGLLIVQGSSTISGPLTTVAGSTLRVNGSPAGTGILTVAGGFTNNAAIELTSSGSGFPAQIITPALTNAAGSTISALPGVGGTRTLTTALNNQGTITATALLAMDAIGAAHTNSGTLDLSGANLTLTQTGGGSFTNTGTVTIGLGQTFSISSGTLNLSAGSVSGAGTLSLNTVVANLTTSLNTSSIALGVVSTTINGPGTVTNGAGQTLTLNTSTIAATSAMINQGLLVVDGSSAISGPLTTAVGSTIRVEGSAAGTGILTVAAGFTNNATIDLTSAGAGFPAQLTVTAGTLVNAAGAAINALPGVGGTRSINAALDNQGSVTLYPGAAGTMSITGSVPTMSGSLNLELGGLTVGTQYDQLAVSGVFNPGGTLNVTLINAFTPVVGNSFTIVTRGSGGGAFATLNLPALGVGTWAVTYNAGSIVLTVQ